MLELANKVISLSGSSSNLVFEELPQDDPKQRCPDISQAKHLLGWEPRIPLEEGIQKTIEYFRHDLQE
jgi:UDP-glucuronate decarboxylase